MRTTTILLCLIVGSASVVFAQTIDRPVRWIVKPSAHVFLPFHQASSVPDQLVSSNGVQYSFTAVSAARYFGNFGFHVDLYAGARIARAADEFAEHLKDMYGSEYYINNSGLTSNPSVGRFMVGMGYKFEKGKWFFLTRLMAGSMAYSVQNGNAALKRMNSNERRTIHWEAVGGNDFSSFVFNPGFTAAYRINNVLALSVDAGYWVHGSDYSISEKTAILDGGNVTTKIYGPPGARGEFSLGVGLMVTW